MEEKKIIEELKRKFPDKIEETLSLPGEETLLIERDSLLALLKTLKMKPYEFNLLLDLTCVDYQGREPRYEMVYHVFSLPHNRRLRIKTSLSENDLSVDSLASLWKNANWLEREVYDMFGVHFKGHPDLQRIFMYDGFEGHPLRKDYPLRKRQPRMALRK
jgi:NADH-quinone oxidoreductase subunit C